MKKLLFIILYINTLLIFSQKKNLGEISGLVINQKNETAIPYATIVCKNLDNKIISGGIANEKGIFTIKQLPLKRYIIQIQFIGFSTLSKEIVLSKATPIINLKKLYLKDKNTKLKDIEIHAEETSVVQKVDRRVINVGKDLIATGTNSLQMLQNIPSVNVNIQTGSISLRGNENIRVLINGKPSNMDTSQLLKQTPSSLIKQIEIITTPSAKYNPEGMSGIINFILKKNMKSGFNGTISVGFEHSKNTRPDVSLNLNYNTGKINLFGNYSSNWGKNSTIQQLVRTTNNLEQKFNFLHDYSDHAFKIGSDIYLDKNNTLSLYTYQNFSNSTLYTNSFSRINNNILEAPNHSKYNESEQNYNVDYKLTTNNKGENIELEVNYSIHKNPEESINRLLQDTNNKLFNYTNSISDTKKSWLVNLDYETPLFETAKLELGIEYRNQKVVSSIKTDQVIEIGTPVSQQPKGNTDFNYDRSMYSGYFNINNNFKKWSIQAGIRLEQFIVNGLFSNTQQSNPSIYSDKIFSIYPSAFLTYHITNKEDIQLAYSRRVDRPSIYQVTPIQEWVSPFTTSEGNQNLIPQFTNSIELNYSKSFSKGTVTFGTFYRKISNKIGRTIQKDTSAPNKQVFSYGNYNTANSYGVEIFGSYKAFSWWKIRPQIETYIQDSQGIINTKNEQVKNTLFKSTLNNSFKINKRIRLQLTAIYRGKSKNIQFEVKPYTMVNIGASLSVLKKKGTITLRGTDIFNGLNYDYFSENPFLEKGNYNLEYNSFYLGFRYNFGGTKNKSRNRKHRDNNETDGGLF
ncbi:Outer membrane receptor for ferrienterochelin and colicins [Tenacibaculum sp. MAR_2010_89]|uniref:outer membrane beta-barrel family protein n=1 Tax=Tenacibaculum sp. MAR_2010_89 TaxID=1250198 RepID=UPI00089B5E5D|nr:outer membrane beta-barrel family protein [Tenacibaculum sp. MAR_2010_89]SEE44749.1 Outer membrane receptor for ferrienterochelin and colicins [Tenacibaculum sp. MAR_2010_89]